MEKYHLIGEDIYVMLKKAVAEVLTGASAASIDGNTIHFHMIDGSTKDMTFPDWEPGAAITSLAMEAPQKLVLRQDNDENFEVLLPGGGLINVIDCTYTVGGVDEGTHYPIGYSLEQVVREILSGKMALTTYIASDKDPDLLRDITDTTSYVQNVTYTYGAIQGRGDITFLDLRDSAGTVVAHWEDVPTGGEKETPVTLPSMYPIGKYTLAECATDEAKRKLIYHAYAEDNSGATADSAHTIEWVFPKYWVVTDGSEAEQDAMTIDTLNATKIKGWHKLVEKGKATTLSDLSCTYGKIGLAYPKYYGDIVSVLDKQGFECLNTFKTRVITIDDCDYNVYWLSDAMSLNKVEQRFM